MRVEGREIMMHHYSPSPRWLAVPGIGFPQNISVGPNVLNPQDFRDWSLTARCKTDGQRDAAAQLIDCVASRRRGGRRAARGARAAADDAGDRLPHRPLAHIVCRLPERCAGAGMIPCRGARAHLVLNFRDAAPPSPRGVLANATPRRFPL